MKIEKNTSRNRQRPQTNPIGKFSRTQVTANYKHHFINYISGRKYWGFRCPQCKTIRLAKHASYSGSRKTAKDEYYTHLKVCSGE